MTSEQPGPEQRLQVAIRSLADYDRLAKSRSPQVAGPRAAGREIGDLILQDLRRFVATPSVTSGKRARE